MRDAAFWRKIIRLAYRKVGGLHFIAIGRITISLSVMRPMAADSADIINNDPRYARGYYLFDEL